MCWTTTGGAHYTSRKRPAISSATDNWLMAGIASPSKIGKSELITKEF